MYISLPAPPLRSYLLELAHVELADGDIALSGDVGWIQGQSRLEVIHGSLPL